MTLMESLMLLLPRILFDIIAPNYIHGLSTDELLQSVTLTWFVNECRFCHEHRVCSITKFDFEPNFGPCV